MEELKPKTPSLIEQVNFITGAVKVLNNQPDAMVVIDQTHVDMMKAIGENVNTVRNWMELPGFHQAALQTLDEAYRLMKTIEGQGEMTSKLTDFIAQISSEVTRFCDNPNDARIAEEVTKQIGSLALIAIGKFFVNGKEAYNG